MWTNRSVFYQIYPLGAFGAPFENDHQEAHRILQIENWLDDLERLQIDCILFNPVFKSMTHGYDTVDFLTIDNRLGTNEDMIQVIEWLHQRDIKVLFDGVFNHVGRDFFAFQDVLQHRYDSRYKEWFYINFEDNNSFDDHLSYRNWEGNEPLVALNLQNHEVVEYLLSAIGQWMETFHIDGIRFDVAYSLDHQFLKEVRTYTKSRNPDFFLLGETLHEDYNTWMNPEMLDSCTNYECYKGLYSSFNSRNLFEISHSLQRQFGQDQWCLYTGKMLLNFVDNHDVVRIASILEKKEYLPLIYVLLMGMPGIPCLYYGSEWGIEGTKNWNDSDLRPALDHLEHNELTDWIIKLIQIKHQEPAFHQADYTQIALTNTACAFGRGDCVVCVNMDENPCTLGINESFDGRDLLRDEDIHIEHEIHLEPYQARIIKRTSR